MITSVQAPVSSGSCKFSDILADPAIRARWEKVRKYFFLRESTYDMSNRCNIRCEGCYYFNGEKHLAAEERDPAAWQALMAQEKERGITFVVLAGAEPSLVPELCRVGGLLHDVAKGQSHHEEEGARWLHRLGFPRVAAIIAADAATKAAPVEIGFLDRFSGSLVITGRVSDVKAAVSEILNTLNNILGFDIPKITYS